ncbi:MAG: carbohydrate porin [Cyanosarcina radialis HA8281-LM2]|nr:carbohydrate porin [Cyanosarcina radialis HA8281-LM2]
MTIFFKNSLLKIGGCTLALAFASEPVRANCLASETNTLASCDPQVENLSFKTTVLEKIRQETEDLSANSQSPQKTFSTPSDSPPSETSIAQKPNGTNDSVEANLTDLTDRQISTQAADLLPADGSSIAQEPSGTDGSAEPMPAETTQPETSDSPPPAAPPKSGNESLGERSYLMGDAWRARLRDAGVTFNLEFTQFYQGLAAGSGDNEFDYGGRLDALINLDTGKLGLWQGGGFHTHLEYRFGGLSAFQDGILMPANTGQILPLGSPDTVVASSLYFSQQFDARTSLLLGKINTVDLLAGDLFFGGSGNQRFMNLAFVAPPKGVVPPAIMGALLSVKTQPVALTVMVFDPNDRTDDYGLNGLFSDGVNLSMAATHVGTISGRPTTYTLNATYSTKESTDLRDLLLPADLRTNGTRQGSYNIEFQFSHLLRQNPNNPREGWGVFLKAAIADGNPNPIQSYFIVGLGGKGLISGRERDSFGLGFYYYNFSNDLKNAVNPLIDFGDEYGIEMYYSYAITPWFYLTGDLQYIDPANQRSDNALVLGLRTNIRF